MKPLIALGAAILSTAGLAQSNANLYPQAAVAFLDSELPLMERAVTAKDREFFAGARVRAESFLTSWGLKSNSSEIERFPACTEAVTDYLIVGLCRISPPGSICDPTTFIPKFEKNVGLCKAAAEG